MLQNPCKTLGFKKNMVYKIHPEGEANHIQPVAYIWKVLSNIKENKWILVGLILQLWSCSVL